MDRTVPIAAARMLDFIRATEVGTDGPSGYNVIYGFNQDKLPKPITQMTIDEVLGAQASWSKRFGSSATGAYQFMRATLTDLKRELGLRGTQVLDPDLQDRLGFHLMKRRGYEAFMAGQLSRAEFGKRLAMEWASFPVLEPVTGAHRRLNRGQSYYSGDALNKALVKPEEVEAVIDEMAILGDAMPAPAPVPIPRPEVPSIGHNGGPPLAEPTRPAAPVPSPVEQSSKAVGAGKWAGLAAAIWQAVIVADVLPAPYDTTEFSTAVMGIIATVAAIVGSYRAQPNAEPVA